MLNQSKQKSKSVDHIPPVICKTENLAQYKEFYELLKSLER